MVELDQSKLFFIIALGRSGSTLLQELMNTFNGFCNVVESKVGPNKISAYEYISKKNDFTYLEQFIRDNWTNEYFVEKTPGSINALPQLHQHYPDANYIFLERNPLKVILSQMNFYPPGQKDREQLERRVRLGLMSEKALANYNYEQSKVEINLREIQNQIAYKHLFANQITIRYEDLVKEPERELTRMVEKFGITPNMENARKVLSRPSHSSRNNKYEIKSLTDPIAIKKMQEACKLWGYEVN